MSNGFCVEKITCPECGESRLYRKYYGNYRIIERRCIVCGATIKGVSL